jgi:hypothetical protein
VPCPIARFSLLIMLRQTSDGAVGGTGQKAAEAAEDESRASKNKPI